MSAQCRTGGGIATEVTDPCVGTSRVLRRAHRRRLRRAVRRRQRRRRHRRLPRLAGRRTTRSRILELAVGTGRLAIPLAALGHDVTGDRRQRGDARPAARRRRRPAGDDGPSATWSTTSRPGRSTSCSSPSTRCSCSPIPHRQAACFAAVASVPRSRRRVRRRGLRAVGSAARRIARRRALDDRRPRRARRHRHRSGDADGHRTVRRAGRRPAGALASATCCAGHARRARRVGDRPPGCASPSATPTSSAPRSPTTRHSTSASIDSLTGRVHTAGFRCTSFGTVAVVS